MTGYVALLRAVNVGGTGKLPMAELRAMCEALGFKKVRTYIASGNAVFDSPLSEPEVKAALEQALERLAANPYPQAASNRTVAIFLDAPPAADTLDGVTGRDTEEIGLGLREVYVHYPDGQGDSKLKIAAAKAGTARNMNTVAKLAEWAQD